jgi:DNA-binding GntR family transcriptional regulator
MQIEQFDQSLLTAQRQAYIYLQDQIVSGAMPGGTRIKPELVAQAVGISRMPVREAIRQLDAEGYVTIRPNRGAVVRSRSPEDVIELYEMRSVLEGLAVRIGASRVTPEGLEDLAQNVERLDRVRRQKSTWVDRHDQLHDQFCATSGRAQLTAECRRLRLALTPYVRLYVRLHDSPESPGHEHVRILNALASGDPDQAERVMRTHVMANAESIAGCLRIPLVAPAKSRRAVSA